MVRTSSYMAVQGLFHHLSMRGFDIPVHMKPLILVILTAITISGCTLFTFHTHISSDNNLKIVRKPDSNTYGFGKMTSLPKYRAGSDQYWERDLRCYDPSTLNLQDNLQELLHSEFDTKTHFPNSLPIGFSPDSIMQTGINPGLNVRKLHTSGIQVYKSLTCKSGQKERINRQLVFH